MRGEEIITFLEFWGCLRSLAIQLIDLSIAAAVQREREACARIAEACHGAGSHTQAIAAAFVRRVRETQ